MNTAIKTIEKNKIIEKLSILAIASIFVAFFFSRFLLSVAQIIFILVGVLALLTRSQIVWNRKNLIMISYALLFILPLITGFYSDDLSYYLERLRIKLPFLLLPISFVLMPSLSRQKLNGLIDLFLLCSLVSMFSVLINYWFNLDAINEELRLGGHFPTPVNHIRYALLMAMAVIFSLARYRLSDRSYRWVYLVSAIVIFIFIHILSVRSGLLSVYLGLLILALYILYSTKNWKLIITMPLGLVLFLSLAWQIPSFKTKMGYTYWEVRELLSNADNHSTLNDRAKSYQCGWQLFKSNKWLGVGAGDTKQEMQLCWKDRFPEDEHFILPHNQYLSFLAGLGILFTIGLVMVCFAPLFWKPFLSSSYSVAVLFMMLSSFLFENTIENSLGVAIFSFFILFLLRFDKIFARIQLI